MRDEKERMERNKAIKKAVKVKQGEILDQEAEENA